MTPTSTKNEPDQTDLGESRGWRPNDGDKVSGKIVAVSRAWSDWTNAFYPLVTIHDDATDRDVEVHCFHQTLESRLMETKPKVGDRLEITFVGKQRTKDGKREVAVYRVNVPDATGREVWDSLEKQPARAAAAAEKGDVPPDDEDIPF